MSDTLTEDEQIRNPVTLADNAASVMRRAVYEYVTNSLNEEASEADLHAMAVLVSAVNETNRD